VKDHILVPLHSARDAEAVLPYLRRLVRLGASEVTLLRTEIPASVDPYTIVSDAVLVHARRYLNEVKGRLSELKVHVRALARIGPPAETILEVAREKESSLILLSAGRRTLLSRLVLGSVPERLVKHSSVPVLVIPRDDREDAPYALPPEIRPVENILVPVDGEESSLAVLPRAIRLALDLNSRILLLRVLPEDLRAKDCAAHEIFETAEEQLYRAGERCVRSGIDFSVLIERGDPAERILSVCRERRVDWIAMATRGKSGLLTRAVSRKVLRGTRLPLLTLRASATLRNRPIFSETAETGRRR
jgi:nucleotide-binding universal stress UspA family protein